MLKYLFQFFNKISPENPKSPKTKIKYYTMMCNTEGYITDIDDDTLSLLLFEKENIVNTIDEIYS